MGCASCSTIACGVPRQRGEATPAGCGSNGNCGTGGCNKLNSFDWLGNMELPNTDRFNIIEVKFKAGKKGFFRNTNYLELFTGDPVVVEAQNGIHIGHVALQGDLVRLQMRKKKVEEDEELPAVIRTATEKDLNKLAMVKNREIPTLYKTREIIIKMGLKMKLSDVEFQADNSKATFYYSADDRVDFRELIKVLASEFKIRVEMRQISLRQEASRLGGIGSCGRELCCSTWLTDFKSVSTAAARYQNLSLNPSKLSGQCGRLKCCLNYELETYIDALVDIPIIEVPIKTKKGEATLQKVDIFKKILWFSYNGETSWYSIPAKRAKEILALNHKGKKPFSLEMNEEEKMVESRSGRFSGALEKINKNKQERESLEREESDRPKSRRGKKPFKRKPSENQGKSSPTTNKAKSGMQERKGVPRKGKPKKEGEKKKPTNTEKPKFDKPIGDKPTGNQGKGGRFKGRRRNS